MLKNAIDAVDASEVEANHLRLVVLPTIYMGF